MSDTGLLAEIEKRLEAKTIHDLRQVARAAGVPRPADGRKERIVGYMLKIATGEADPALPPVRGAHPKSAEYDRQLVADIFRCREAYLSARQNKEEQRVELSVSSGEREGEISEGYGESLLEGRDGKWFVRIDGADVSVNPAIVNMLGLREGDKLSCKYSRRSSDGFLSVVSVPAVNGLPPVQQTPRVEFESLTPVYPDRKFSVALSGDDIAGRMVDLFSPVGAGQRAFIVTERGADKSGFIKKLAKGLQSNNDIKLIILLIDCAPEVAADFKRSFASADVFISAMDAGAAEHIRTATLALEYAKRQTELALDTVFVLDDITSLTRALGSCGKQVASALDASALDGAKRFLAAARNAEEGGSLTVISALSVGEGDAVDGAIYSGLKDTGNMFITLYPHRSQPVDIFKSYAAGGERLLSEHEINAAYILRQRYTAEQILQLFKETSSNGELCARPDK